MLSLLLLPSACLAAHFLCDCDCSRWGDAPVRFLGVAMNVDERKTEALHGIQCAHN